MKDKLTRAQYYVTQEAATKRAFTGRYWNHKEKGIYVDVVTGEPLFASTEKYDSRCGWPSFTKPIVPTALREQQDTSFSTIRTEVRSTMRKHIHRVVGESPKAPSFF